MTIAVTGATGQLGRLVVAKLKERTAAEQIVALARSPEKAGDLGVEVRPFDYAKTDSLVPGLARVETLLLISSSEVGQRSAQHRDVVAAATAAGVRRIVYTSLLHADTSPLNLAAEHLDTEAALAQADIPVTILRHGWYTENYTGSISGALAGGVFLGSAGDARIASAARADYAEAAAVVLTTTGHDGKVYELAGDTAWTLSDLAGEVSRQTGRDIPYKDLPATEYAAILVSFGLPDALAGAIAGWDVAASRGALFDDGRQLSTLIGRSTTPLAAVVEAALS
ncbi:NAD(P)H-binding protein [Sphingomonas sp. CFBP 13720]|uniref:NAD(P)H-binding protein n=1 Tax=Sphingomonas sp. CFBP 13720 TaxID=2775302 RepID=UPI0017811F7F|nr:NAD(P)H-binding protein [Sphingomonas sp. CFBP 13720]MBD8677579.1 NAD(P)H-binding protein [Sphingomonas sp. CFBP 13720]